jgi:uncharacterized protein with GYD domain
MPTYVVLMNWTEQGVGAAKGTVDRYEAARGQFGESGITFRDSFWTVGPYDVVSVVDAPDDETLSAALLTLAGAGNLRTTMMRAFDPNEMRGVIAKMG